MIGLLLLGAWLGLCGYLAALCWSLPLPHLLIFPLLALSTGALIVALAALAIREREAPRAGFSGLCRDVWPSALLLMLLPVGLLSPQRIFRPIAVLLGAAAFAVYHARTDH